MRMAIAQINTQAGDFEATSKRVVELSRQAARDGVDLMLLPMAAFTGPCIPDHASSEGFALDLGAVVEGLAHKLACACLIPVAMSERLGTPFSHEALLIRDGGITPVCFASWLLGSMAEEGDFHTQGTFEFGGLRFAVAFAYDDLRTFEDEETDVDVILYVPNQGFALDDPSSALGASLLESRFRDEAWSFDAWIVGVGSLGGYDLQVFTGSSFVLTPKGELVACAPAFEEALLVADIDDDGRDVPQEFLEPEIYDRSLHLWEALTLGLRDQLHKQGQGEVALVLDGRLNTSVLAALATDSLGPTHVHAFVDESQDEEHRRLAERMAHALHIDLQAPLCTGANATGARPSPFKVDKEVWHDFAQVRLAALARKLDVVPLSAIDKTFLALEAEPSTCNAAALAPLGDVYRSDVIELAHLRNTISPILEAASIASYDVPLVEGLDEVESTPEGKLRRIDVVLATHIEWERSLTDVAARQGCEEICTNIVRSLARREFARLALPPCIAVSSRTVREARVPLGVAWHDHVREEESRLPNVDLLSELAASIGPDAELPSEGPAQNDNVQDQLSAQVASMLERMQEELAEAIDTTTDSDAPQRQVGELLGLLHDILQEGSFSGGVGGDVPFGPLTWGSPFSEN